ncbi:MAG: hypothetical protein NVSMB52_10670 [Chloroflexota bacterium]
MDLSLQRIPAPIPDVFAVPWYRLFFLGIAASVSFLYSIFLPFALTQRLSLSNWHYLSTEWTGFSIAFGLLIGWIVTLQVYAVSRVAQGRGQTLTLGAVVGSLLPSMVCCTPVVPTLLALFGLSTVSIYGLSGRIQSFFALHERYIMLASLLLLVGSALWSMRKLRTSACLTEGDSL